MAETYVTIEELLKQGIDFFRTTFQGEPTIAACGPGRVNLIGEHTDYNNGFVLPMALPLATIVIGRGVCQNTASICTSNKTVDPPFLIKFTTNQRDLTPCVPKWANYIKGVVALFPSAVPGFEAIFVSTVPTGGGLSSSASLEVATYTFLEALTNNPARSLPEKALICQQAEHKFAGMPCGIMDQFVSTMANKGCALLIDCKTNTSEQIPFEDPNLVVVITNSNKKHELTGSEYSQRKEQCVEAAKLLKLESLRQATTGNINDLISLNASPLIIKRAKHIITEIERTVVGAKALKEKDYAKFGKLMAESHESLKSDFEVSTPELDQLVDIAIKVPGVYGSRMTGGGFGGCTVTLVTKDAVNSLIVNIHQKYSGKATVFICNAEDGARLLKI